MDPLAEIREVFFQECEEQLGELEAGLMALEQGTGDAETVNAVFRAVHSIKGGAGAFALEALVHFAHAFEAALDHLRAGRLIASQAVIGLLLRAADGLADLVRIARGGDGGGEEARIHALESELGELNSSAMGASAADSVAAPPEDASVALPVEPPRPLARVWSIRFKPWPGLYAKANETAVLMRELGRLGALEVTVDCSELPDLACLDPEGAYLSWTAMLHASCDETAIRQIFEFVDGDCELEIREITADGSNPPAEPASGDDLEAMIRAIRSGEDAERQALRDMPDDREMFGGEIPGGEMPGGEIPGGEIPGGQTRGSVPAQQTADVAVDAPANVGAGATEGREPAKFSETKSRAAPPASGSGEAAAATPEAAAGAKAASAAGTTIRVDLDRVDRMIDLVGELVINGSMLSQRVLEAGLAHVVGVEAALDDLSRITREIQDSVMAIRAQPVRSVFQRMPRLVREVAGLTGKQVRLVTEGEATEVDKTVIERIVDPLTHMIRNAIDHGLEAPARRIAAGKLAEGVVRLAARHRSGRIVIQVEDDGAGIDRERVHAKAVENGIVDPDAKLSDEEIDNLIFLPGFSTAKGVSDISGRGVGMDVVRRSVQALGGRISIASRPGSGSTFTLSLPLTLAVLDGMVVTVAGHTLIVPLSAMIEAMRPNPAAIHALGRDARVINLRGGCLSLVDVAIALGYRSTPLDPDKCVAMLVESGGGVQSVLLVDAIQGQRQVVIKSLEANYRAVPGIAAATVMGDGRVALILDIDTIVSSHGDTVAAEMRLAAAS